MRVRKRGILAAWVLVTMARSDAASAFPHVVAPKETLAQIATTIYGSAKYEGLLAAANSLDREGGSPIVPGMRLEVPAPSHRRVTGSETWHALAQKWLGDERRADVLARVNGGVPWVPPSEGQEVVIPYVLTVVAGEGERIDALATKYLGDANAGWQIDAYNFRKGVTLKRADVLLVPLLELPLTDAGRTEAKEGLASERSEGAGTLREEQRRIEAELPQLLADVRGGRYVEAVARGTRLLAHGDATRAQKATVERALLESFVALDASGAAQVACAGWKASAPDEKLDPVTVSPKIRAACVGR